MVASVSLRFLLIFSVLTAFLSTAYGQQKKRVLFLGNSYVYVNNLPQMLANVATSMGDTLIFDSNCPGGHTLQGHSTNATSLAKIRAGNWDYVILQEQSQRPAFPDEQVAEEVFPYAHVLDSLVHAYNPCGRTMFYQTWGRKNGDASNCAFWPPICTYAGMDSLLALRYVQLADSNEAVLSPVGAVWRYLRQNNPSIELYQADESHPSVAGTYAAACCFYTALFGKNPGAISYDAGLGASIVNPILEATGAMVYDSLAKWHIGEYSLSANFSYAQDTGYTYLFTSTLHNATGQQWTFGDSIRTEANPTFTFADSGLHEVGLTAYNACDTVTSSQWVYVPGIPANVGVEEANPLNIISVAPNPFSGRLVVSLHGLPLVAVTVYSAVGEKVFEDAAFAGGELGLQALAGGLYRVVFTWKGVSQVVAVLKE